MNKKFIAGGLSVIIAGVTSALVVDFAPEESVVGRYNVLYVVDAGGKDGLTDGEALIARADLTQDFSAVEKGEAEPLESPVRFTVRTMALTEAEANSVNAACKCFQVNDLENPTAFLETPTPTASPTP